MKIRIAQISDLPRLSDLVNQLGYQLSEAILKDRLDEYLSDPCKSIFVAEHNHQVAGFLSYHILPQFHSEELHLRIVSLVVDQAHRRKGVGKFLILEAERIAKMRGCACIELTSAMHREKAHAFYQSLGFLSPSEKRYFSKELDVPH